MAHSPPEDLLGAILSAWKEDPMQPINITRLAKRLQRNRREIKGALEVLHELGLLQSTTWSKTRKEYRFNKHFTYHFLQDRLHKIIPPHTGYKRPQLTIVEWRDAMKPLIQALIPPERLRWCIDNLADYESIHAFARTIYGGGYQRKWSPDLPDLERERLAMKLEDLVFYAAFHWNMQFILDYFQECLASEGG